MQATEFAGGAFEGRRRWCGDCCRDEGAVLGHGLSLTTADCREFCLAAAPVAVVRIALIANTAAFRSSTATAASISSIFWFLLCGAAVSVPGCKSA